MLLAAGISFLLAQSVEFAPLTLAQPQTWGVYFTASTAAQPKSQELVDSLQQKGAKLIVVDMQFGGGKLAYPSQLPLSLELKNTGDLLKDPKKMVEDFHAKGIYAIARVVLFKQDFLAHRKPEWALKGKWDKKPFTMRDGLAWLDSSNPEVENYLLDVTKEVADFGFDEIQFDYVRFPEAGRGGQIFYTFTEDGKKTRDEAITNFVKDAAAMLHWMNVSVSVDVFGVVAWNNVDWKLIGQNIPELSKYVDYISPMVYPSHFSPGFSGYKNPGDGEYQIVRDSMEKFLMQAAGGTAKMRPWLQGFNLKTSHFGPKYIENQARGLRELGIDQFLIWNASNNYWATLKAKL